MNSCMEFEGKNVEIAIEAACKELDIPKSKLKYDIISTGSTGIFAFLSNRKAKIRVKIDNGRKKNFKKDYGKKAGVKNLVDEAFGVKEKDVLKKVDLELGAGDVAFEEVLNQNIEGGIFDGQTPVEIGTVVIERITQLITDGAKVTSEVKNGVINYRIEGGNSAVLIGKRGQTLEAIQYLVDKIVKKQSEQKIRIQVDIEGYLEERKENLVSLAIRMAEKVKKGGKPSTIGQMSSQDRRIVHLALKDDREVRTQSMGEGYYRRLVIFPRKSKPKKKKNNS